MPFLNVKLRKCLQNPQISLICKLPRVSYSFPLRVLWPWDRSNVKKCCSDGWPQSAEISMETKLKKTQLINFHLTSQRVAFLLQLYIGGREVEQHCDLHKATAEQGIRHIWLPGPPPAPPKTIAFISHYHISRKECVYTDEEIWTTKFQHTPLGEECVWREN